MSTRFWTGSAALIGASAIFGLTLGSFATRVPSRDFGGYATTSSDEVGDSPSMAAQPDNGPGEILCKGCGPTLAERQMAADNPGWDPDGMVTGSTDPMVTDYEAQKDYAPLAEPPSTDMHRLPANIQRFADGEEGQSAIAPPPTLVTTAAAAPPT